MDSIYQDFPTTEKILEGHDFSNKYILITGSTSGLGQKIALELFKKNANLILLGRNQEQLVKEKNTLLSGASRKGEIHTYTVDQNDLKEVKKVSETIKRDFNKIDIIINNAGIMALENKATTVQGFEKQFGVNHLSHFVLNTALIPLLAKSDAPRVVTVSSAGHDMSDIIFDDINYDQRNYNSWEAYGQSKTANALFALQFPLEVDFPLISYSLHPGNVGGTNLGRHMSDKVIQDWVNILDELSKRFNIPVDNVWADKNKSVSQGAATIAYALITEKETNGSYLVDCGEAIQGNNVHENGKSEHIENKINAKRLWEISEEMGEHSSLSHTPLN